MKTIKLRLWLSGIASGGFLILLICMVVIQAALLGIAAAIAALSALASLLHDVRSYASAKLIFDNRIINICAATVTAAGRVASQESHTIECVFSPFGLLIGGKVYKFGRDGIRLRSIGIEDSRITVEFGDDARHWRAVLLYDPLSKEELLQLTETICYETGISLSAPEANHPE